jgi:hypothetical protein
MRIDPRAGAASALLLSLALASAPAPADDGIFEGSGGTVSLSQSKHVRMVAEEVVFDLTTPDLIRVSCLFVVVNEGPADTLLLGFPDFWPADDDDSHQADGRSAIRDLVVMVDGLPVVTTAVPAADAPTILGARTTRAAWNVAHVWPCAFAPGQTRVLRTEYCHRYSMMVGVSHVVNYALRTGASWAGPIGKVVVRIVPGELRVKERYGLPWERVGGEYVWTAADLEPTEDIWIGLAHPADVARYLEDHWRRSTSSGRPEDLKAARRSVWETSMLHGSRPDCLAEVRDALSDSVPELRAFLEELPCPATSWPA